MNGCRLQTLGDTMELRSITGILWVYAKAGLSVGHRDREVVATLAGLARGVIQKGRAQQRVGHLQPHTCLCPGVTSTEVWGQRVAHLRPRDVDLLL